MNTSLNNNMSEHFLKTWGEFLDKSSEVVKDKIFKTIPTGAYDMHVAQIIHDASRASVPCTKDISITESQRFKVCKSELGQESIKIQNRIDTLREELDSLIEKYESDNSSNRKTNSNKINKLNIEIDKYVEELQVIKEHIELANSNIAKAEHEEMVFRGHEIRLERAEHFYRISKKTEEDLAFLKKIVHYTHDSFDKFMYGNNYIAPYPGHLLDPEKSPFSKAETARKNRGTLIDWYDENW
jgi:predicted RNase H-like nuclease (RuvC/YqgF family)